MQGVCTGALFCKIRMNRNHETLDIWAFLRYVDGNAAEGAFVQEVDKEVRRVKQHDETRREYMTLAMELKRMFAEGEKSGEEKKETMMILAMLRKGFSVESIAECAQTSVEYIMELGKKNRLCEAFSVNNC